MHGDAPVAVGFNQLGVCPFRNNGNGCRERGDEGTAKPAVGTDAAGNSQDFGTSWWRLSNHSTSGDSHTEETLSSEIVKVFGCRPMMTAPRTLGPASANLQGRKPRNVGRSGASDAMGISSLAVCAGRSLNAFCGRDQEGWRT